MRKLVIDSILPRLGTSLLSSSGGARERFSRSPSSGGGALLLFRDRAGVGLATSRRASGSRCEESESDGTLFAAPGCELDLDDAANLNLLATSRNEVRPHLDV